MKLFIFFSIIFASVIFSGCSSTAKTATNEQDLQLETRIYEVFGMGCPGCESGLCNLIKKIDTVYSCEASWKKKRLVINFKEGNILSDEEVYSAIREANFTPGKRIRE